MKCALLPRALETGAGGGRRKTSVGVGCAPVDMDMGNLALSHMRMQKYFQTVAPGLEEGTGTAGLRGATEGCIQGQSSNRELACGKGGCSPPKTITAVRALLFK